MYHIYENFVSKVLPELVEWPGKRFLFSEFTNIFGIKHKKESFENFTPPDGWGLLSDYNKASKIQPYFCLSINLSIQKREIFIRNAFQLDKVLTKVFPDENVDSLLKDYYPFVLAFYQTLQSQKEAKKIEAFSKVLNPKREAFSGYYSYPSLSNKNGSGSASGAGSSSLNSEKFMKLLVWTSLMERPLENPNTEIVEKLFQDLLLDGRDASQRFLEKLIFVNFVQNTTEDRFFDTIYQAWENKYLNSNSKVRNGLVSTFLFYGSGETDSVSIFKEYYSSLKNVPDLSHMDWALYPNAIGKRVKKQIFKQLQAEKIMSATKENFRDGVANNLLNGFMSLYKGEAIQPILDFKASVGLKNTLGRSDLKSVISKDCFTKSPENKEILLTTFSGLNMSNKENTFKSLDLLKSPLWVVESLVKSCNGGEMILGYDFLDKQIKKIMNANGNWSKENIYLLEDKLSALVEKVPEYVTPEFNVRVITYSLAFNRIDNALFNQIKENDPVLLNEVLTAYSEEKKEWKKSRALGNPEKKTHDGSFEFCPKDHSPIKVASAYQAGSASRSYIEALILKLHLDKVIQKTVDNEDFTQEGRGFKL